MSPAWLLLIVPLAFIAGVLAAYYHNTYRGLGPWD
jgi:hypothetical protein